ncbi:MAG: response regulator transcription factor [Candidatus Promineifilaceae bacterium]|nr:response regulator transcription factor [Candidatus Promineifilaceae bacterium]
MAATILVVDDKANVRTLLRDYLQEQGFAVATAENGRVALFVAREARPDLVLLDLMMPEMDGYAFIRNFRKSSDTPIILLTASVEETDKVLGLEMGADDYVTKPFGMRELVARIRAVLRRANGGVQARDVVRVAGVELDHDARRVTVDGEPVSPTPSEFDLLSTLIASPGHVFSRIELLERLQGTVIEGAEKTINVHVHNLRHKIEADPSDPAYIETVFGVGYRFARP